MCDLYIVPIAVFSSVRATASMSGPFLEHSSCRLLGLGQIALSNHEGVISRVCYLFAPTLHSPLEGSQLNTWAAHLVLPLFLQALDRNFCLFHPLDCRESVFSSSQLPPVRQPQKWTCLSLPLSFLES